MRAVYLHGFASSPQSSKACFFGQKFAEEGIDIEIPQLDSGDFRSLTLTGQISVLDRAMGGRPAILMGSSLGGYLAAWYAARHPEVEKLVLLAPAFQFIRRWHERYSTEEMEAWKRNGALPMFHYTSGTMQDLGYQFAEDAQQYEDEPDFPQPALILHGRHDTVVPASVSEDYARRHANVRLELFDSGHELTDVMEPMWSQVRQFLGIPTRARSGEDGAWV